MNRHRQTPGYRALRAGRASAPGQRYLITTLCRERHPHFSAWPIASSVSSKLEESSLWNGSRLLCWVLMPDHLHMLIELGDCASLSALIRRVKSVTALAANRAANRSGSVWMPGFHDHALRAEESTVDVVRYIIENPIRAGLVREVGAYPYWNTMWLGEDHDLG